MKGLELGLTLLRLTVQFYYDTSKNPIPLVALAGLEPARSNEQQIFLLLYVTIAALLRCSLDYVFTISYDLGGWYIVSTHL